MNDTLAKLVREILDKQHSEIDNAVYTGLIQGCGVRVERGRFDATKFSAKPDKSVPLGEIHEHIID